MAEKPEQVLKQQWIAATAWVEERGAKVDDPSAAS
jgi:hypothetical protein